MAEPRSAGVVFRWSLRWDDLPLSDACHPYDFLSRALENRGDGAERAEIRVALAAAGFEYPRDLAGDEFASFVRDLDDRRGRPVALATLAETLRHAPARMLLRCASQRFGGPEPPGAACGDCRAPQRARPCGCTECARCGWDRVCPQCKRVATRLHCGRKNSASACPMCDKALGVAREDVCGFQFCGDALCSEIARDRLAPG